MPTLIPEDGTGLETANVYAARAAADTYHDDRGNAAWAAASTDARDRALIRATEFLDASYVWRGYVLRQAQALAWPRRRYFNESFVEGYPSAYGQLVDRDGRYLDGVPVPVQRATFELALLAINVAYAGGFIGGTSGQSSATAQGAQKRVKAGPVEVEWFGAAAGASIRQAMDSGLLPNGAGELIDRILWGLFIPPQGGRVSLAKA